MKSTTFCLGSDSLNIFSLHKMASSIQPIFSTCESNFKKVNKQRSALEKQLKFGKTMYGVNTGFGFLSSHKIPPDDVNKLQLKIIRSHACGVGKAVQKEIVRAMMLIKAHNFLSGSSAVSSECIYSIISMLKHNIIPFVPSQGSVGASGDLAPLAHIALALIGEGQVCLNEQIMPAAEALKTAGIAPYTAKAKEGLSLLNGTQYMSAEGAFALMEAKNLLNASTLISALSLLGFNASLNPFDPRVHELKPHSGQIRVAAEIMSIFQHPEGSKNTLNEGRNVQDPYSFRCIPQVHGLAFDTWEFVRKIVETELNSITDNPLIFDDGSVLSAGNFHGQYLSSSFDYLAIALSEIGSISERRTEKLTIKEFSNLPNFLTTKEGLNSGLMIPQVVASALVSENKILCHPASIDSIPSSANKEDHVSMGPIAAQKLRKICQNVARILAIEAITSCQAIDLSNSVKHSPKTEDTYNTIRSVSKTMDEDRSLHPDIENISTLIIQGKLKNEQFQI